MNPVRELSGAGRKVLRAYINSGKFIKIMILSALFCPHSQIDNGREKWFPNGGVVVMLIIGVAGGTGAGKTALVRGLAGALASEGVSVIQLDNYYHDQSRLSANLREEINFDHPGTLDLDLLVEHLKDLISGKPIEMPFYDFASHTRVEAKRRVLPEKYIIVEGIFALYHAGIRDLLDLKVFVSLECDLRFIRRLERDISERGRTRQSVIRQYLATVRPMHDRHVQPTCVHADLVLSGDDPVESNVAKILNRLDALK